MAPLIDIPAGGAVFIAVLFIIGLLVGIVAKRAFKLAIAIIALVVLLGIAGYISPPSQQTIYNVFSQGGIVSRVSQVATLLPFSSAVFLIGLALGIWKG